jgi:hypothetical protein
MSAPNAFSIHDLVGFVVTAVLALSFYGLYGWKDRRLINLLFANFVAWAAVGCLLTFLQDNVVSQSADVVDVRWARERTLLWFRLSYGVGLMALPSQLHLVLRYCRSGNALARHVVWLYAGALLLQPMFWTPLVLEESSLAYPVKSGWACAVPYMPDVGLLVYVLVFLWAAVQVYTQVLLWQFQSRGGAVGDIATRVGLIRLALLVSVGGLVIDLLNAALGFKGIAVLPITSVVMTVLVGAALWQEHREAVLQRPWGGQVAAAGRRPDGTPRM